MIRLVKPTIEYKDKYIDMIKEWKEYGGPYVPCIVDYDCNNIAELTFLWFVVRSFVRSLIV